MALPKHLYKYRSFNENSLRLLSEGEAYYANPTSFNDPLDCNLSFAFDCDFAALEELWLHVHDYLTEPQRELVLNDIRHNTKRHGNYKTDPDVEAYYMRSLANDVRKAIASEFGKRGVLSLSETFNCPLMWSHYANDHRGICIEYDTTDVQFRNLRAVNYDRERNISMQRIIDWKLRGSKEAENEVFDTFFYSKASSWRYEQEWRDVADNSTSKPAPALVSGVYFGLRCDSAAITAIVKLLSGQNIEFYDIRTGNDGFTLLPRPVDIAEVESCGVRSSILFDFRDLTSDKHDDA